MVHLWVRAEQRANEKRVGLSPEDAAKLVNAGIKVTVEESTDRIIPTESYSKVGCVISKQHSWQSAPKEAIILGLKELPENIEKLEHKHIMFGHAFKGQSAGKNFLKKFKAGKGILYDLEYLTDAEGRRLAAFGYWAGFAGAAISIKAYASQKNESGICGPISVFDNQEEMIDNIRKNLFSTENNSPKILVVGALGRVGQGAIDFCQSLGLNVTKWDIGETKHGGPFPEILMHEVFLNCILAKPGAPVFVNNTHLIEDRKLRVIGDISCDPDSSFNPIPIYSSATNWEHPVIRVSDSNELDVMAIDNLPSLLPYESSIDFSRQLIPLLLGLDSTAADVWDRAEKTFIKYLKEV